MNILTLVAHIHYFWFFVFYNKDHVKYRAQIHWDFSHGKLRLPSLGKASYDRVALPNYGACWVSYCFNNPPKSEMDYRNFNVRTYVNARGCPRGCTDTARVCTESWFWEKHLLPHRGIEPASAACRTDALLTELHPQTAQLTHAVVPQVRRTRQ